MAIVGVLFLAALTAIVLLFGSTSLNQMRGLLERLSAVVKTLSER